MKYTTVMDDNLSQLIINNDVFTSVMSEIRSHTMRSIPQPMIIVGQEGAGKTTLLKRLHRSCADIQCSWIDGRSIFSSDDIIHSCQASDASIVFIDNIDFYLTRCSYNEQFRLRQFLNQESAPMLIATASKVLPAMTDYEAPFFEGIKICYIDALTDIDIRHIFTNESDRALRMFKLLPPTIHSVTTISHVIHTNNEGSTDIEQLLSLFSGRYRNVYQNLPVNSQHILNALGATEGSMTIPQLRNHTGMTSGNLTSYLRTLRNADLINIDKTIKKHSRYSIKDPLLHRWLRLSSPSNSASGQ